MTKKRQNVRVTLATTRLLTVLDKFFVVGRFFHS